MFLPFWDLLLDLLSCLFPLLFAAFWSWKLPFERHFATFLEFEPLIVRGICNTLALELFMFTWDSFRIGLGLLYSPVGLGLVFELV
jgi:hypothetical protein